MLFRSGSNSGSAMGTSTCEPHLDPGARFGFYPSRSHSLFRARLPTTRTDLRKPPRCATAGCFITNQRRSRTLVAGARLSIPSSIRVVSFPRRRSCQRYRTFWRVMVCRIVQFRALSRIACRASGKHSAFAIGVPGSKIAAGGELLSAP